MSSSPSLALHLFLRFPFARRSRRLFSVVFQLPPNSRSNTARSASFQPRARINVSIKSAYPTLRRLPTTTSNCGINASPVPATTLVSRLSTTAQIPRCPLLSPPCRLARLSLFALYGCLRAREPRENKPPPLIHGLQTPHFCARPAPTSIRRQLAHHLRQSRRHPLQSIVNARYSHGRRAEPCEYPVAQCSWGVRLCFVAPPRILRRESNRVSAGNGRGTHREQGGRAPKGLPSCVTAALSGRTPARRQRVDGESVSPEWVHSAACAAALLAHRLVHMRTTSTSDPPTNRGRGRNAEKLDATSRSNPASFIPIHPVTPQRLTAERKIMQSQS